MDDFLRSTEDAKAHPSLDAVSQPEVNDDGVVVQQSNDLAVLHLVFSSVWSLSVAIACIAARMAWSAPSDASTNSLSNTGDTCLNVLSASPLSASLYPAGGILPRA